jgi:hypothetical protein
LLVQFPPVTIAVIAPRPASISPAPLSVAITDNPEPKSTLIVDDVNANPDAVKVAAARPVRYLDAGVSF